MLARPVYKQVGAEVVQVGIQAANPRREWVRQVRKALERKLGRPLTKEERRFSKRFKP